MPQLDPVPVGVALDSAGAIESGALLKVYTAGTTTSVTTYQDAALTTAHAFPVVADSSGRFAEIYVAAGNYKIDLQDAEGSSLPGYPRDNISLTASGVTTGATYGRAIQLSNDYSDTDAWTIESSVGITARAQGYDSTTELFDDPFVLEFAGDASDATNKVESAASVATVTPGQELRVTAPIYATGSPTSTFEIGLEWYTSAGVTISETVTSYQNSDITTGQVLHGSKLATAPATAAGVRVIGQRKTASVTGNWYMGAARLEIGGVSLVEDTTPQLGGVLDTNSKQVRWSKGADVASAGALTLGSDGNFFDITGTTAITSIGTLGVGTTVMLQFDGALTLTHHATDLILPGGANITTAAGDIAIFTEYASGDWVCVSYQVAASSPGGWVYLSSQATTSGTEVDFTVPTSAREIVVGLVGVSLSGTDNILIQLGDGGGIETTNYQGGVSNDSVEVISTSGFAIQGGAGARLQYGVVHLNDLGNDGTIWGCLIAHENNGGSVVNAGGGTKTLSAAITTVRVTRSGTDTFDAGAAYCKYR